MKYKSFGYYAEDCPVHWSYAEEYEILVNMETNEVVCMLGESEDRTFGRDLRSIVELLNNPPKEVLQRPVGTRHVE